MSYVLTLGGPDDSLNADSMLIQVKDDITSSWYAFGEALGVSQEKLNWMQTQDHADYEKLVEICYDWFEGFPRGSKPTWRDVAKALQTAGFHTLSSDIMKVYTTGKARQCGL